MESANTTGASPPRVFIFDAARLRSHVFFRYASTHPQLEPHYHPYMYAATFGPEHLAHHHHHVERLSKELKDNQAYPSSDTFGNSTQSLLDAAKKAEQDGRVLLANEHWYNVMKQSVIHDCQKNKINEPADLGQNPTCLPNELFDTLTPIILIRHPALSINSIFKDAVKFINLQTQSGKDGLRLITSNKTLRILFDFFAARGKRPVVVDAEDLLFRTKEIADGLGAALNVDPAGFSDTWNPVPKEQVDRMHPFVQAMTLTWHQSKGILRPEVQPEQPDLAQTGQKWEKMYGAETAGVLKAFAEENMIHYEYLKQFKL